MQVSMDQSVYMRATGDQSCALSLSPPLLMIATYNSSVYEIRPKVLLPSQLPTNPHASKKGNSSELQMKDALME